MQIIVLFSNKLTVEKFFKIRKKLCVARWVANLIAVLGIFYFKLYGIAMIMGSLMLYGAIEDIIFGYFLEKIISNKK